MSYGLPFPPSDYALRMEATRRVLREREIECAVFMGPEVQYWLCGYDTFLGALLPQALVVTADDRPPILIVWDADIAIARASSLIEDIRSYRFGVDDPVAPFVEVAQSRMQYQQRIAIDLSSRALPYRFGTALARLLADVELVDVTAAMARLRSVKSPAELALMRIAGRYADLGLGAARRHAKPGMTEIQLAAEVEYAMRGAGCDYASIPTELASGPRSLFGHGTPVHRALQPGDLFHLEVGGVERRYNCIGMQTMVVPGASPSKAGSDLYDLAARCLRARLAQLRPGVPAAAVEEPALEIVRRAGLDDVFKMRFGYGVGIGYPPSWLEALQITRTSRDVLDVGTTFVLHACLLDDAASTGVVVGGSYAITESGYERLSGAGAADLA